MGMHSSVTGKVSEQPCSACGLITVKGQWWHIRRYFGLDGYFCSVCFDKISHNSYGKPNDPEGFNEIAVMMKLKGMK